MQSVVSEIRSRSASSSEHSGFTWLLSTKECVLCPEWKFDLLLDVVAYLLYSVWYVCARICLFLDLGGYDALLKAVKMCLS